MLALVLALLCVAANAFFVAAEFALAKVRPSALQALADQGDSAAARAHALTQHLDAYLGATQLGITLASLGLGWLGEPAIARFIEPPLVALGAEPGVVHGVALTLAFSVISLLHIVIGELVPKSLAIQRPEQVSRATARLLRAFFLVTYPAMWVLNGLSLQVLRLLRLPPVTEGALSADELRLLIQATFQGRPDLERKRELLERVLRGTDRPVRAIMVPRVDMVTLDVNADPAHCLRAVREHGFSRYPVCEGGNPDKVVGYVYAKDVVMARDPRVSLRTLRRDVLFVPENRTVGDVLAEMQQAKLPIAVVVDEYGGTSGLATLEDLVEEIVGEIQDETDLETPRLVTRSDGSIVIEGTMPVTELNLKGLDLPPLDGADTLGGYVVASLGRLAHPGDRLRLGRYDVVVESVRRRRVDRVTLLATGTSRPPPPDAADAAPDLAPLDE